MHQDPEAQLQQITRLLDNSAHAPKADPTERLRGFILATEGYPIHIMRRAVNNFISGTTDPKHDPNWPLQPAHLANECRRLHTSEAEHDQRNRLAIAQIREREEAFHQQPAEVRRAAVTEGLARLRIADPLERQKDPQLEAMLAQRRQASHDALFVDQSPEATKARLFKQRS